jgi:hypothetical protein
MLKSKGEETSSSTGGLNNWGRRIVPDSDELSNPGQDLLNQTKSLGNLPRNLKKMHRHANGKL